VPTSTSQAAQSRSAAFTDVVPPAGNQHVTAATNTSSSDVRSGGTDRQTSDTARTAPASTPRRLPEITPSGMPPTVAATRATTASTAVLAAALTTTPRTGRL
jgi:hypothetical protein